MRGMELWRPDWSKINGEYGDPDACELVQVTRETARIGLSSIQHLMEQDYYDNYGAAAAELRRVLTPLPNLPQEREGK